MARYIDADKLYAEMEDLYEHHIEMKNFSADGAVADCLDILEKQPTANVEEVKHGEWLYSRVHNILHCSECGEIPECFEPPYCPNCGAKMDEVSK